jgi:hypothetical protein
VPYVLAPAAAPRFFACVVKSHAPGAGIEIPQVNLPPAAAAEISLHACLGALSDAAFLTDV